MIDLTDIGTSTRFNNGKADAMGMITPLNIVNNMVDLVFENIAKSDANKHIKEYKFIDICCKSGNFLRQIYVKLMEHPDMINEFEDRDYRSKYILNNMLYGICFCESDTLISTRNVYGRLVKDSNIKYIPKWCDIVKNKDDKFTYESLKETFGDMKFDIVIGNPPYNNDMYLDFVQLGKKLVGGGQHSSVCMITPAKWQAKGGEKNEKFRREIVPYMSDIVYYPDCGDIFDIRLQGGVAYYLIDKDKHETTNIINHCERVKAFESNGIEVRYLDERKCFINSDILYNICNKVGCFHNEFEYWKFGATPIKDNYNVFATAVNTDAGGKTSFHVFSNDGKLTMLAPFNISKETFFRSNDTKCFFTSINEDEANNFISWANTKFVRFMLLMRYCTYHNNNDESWSFVPEPGKFDHIFTDQELYGKYGLTEEEIEIIESVIKERK